MGLFFQVLLPIITVFAAGFMLQRIRPVDGRSVAAVSLYVLSPCLVFIGLYEANFDSDYLIITFFMFGLFYFMVFANKVLAKILGWNQKRESAAILSTGFINSGNYGLPVVLFSLGEKAFPYAIFIMILQSLQNNFFGIYYASRSTSGMKKALINVMKMPTTYAAFLAITLQYSHITLPTAATSTISLVGNAAIPLMMVMLGIQLGSIRRLQESWPIIISSVTLKMLIAPVIAFFFVALTPLDPLIGLTIIIISAMPPAATTTMYAIEFDTEPDLVSSITFISTLVSVISVTVLLNIIL